jgi:hypothetical protein
MTAAVCADTWLVETVNVAEVEPVGTLTIGGTVAVDGMLLLRVTAVPGAVAGPESTTVPCDGAPPMTEEGFSEMETIVTPGTSPIPSLPRDPKGAADTGYPTNEPIRLAEITSIPTQEERKNSIDFILAPTGSFQRQPDLPVLQRTPDWLKG